MKIRLIATGLAALVVCAFGAIGGAVQTDVVVYGSTPAAISAAIQAKRMGRSVVVVSPETRIGGLTTGGLGQTDIGNKAAFGGIALEFYRAVADYYSNPDNLKTGCSDSKKRERMAEGVRKAGSKWTFEPSAALSILEGWEKRDCLDIRRNEWIDRERGVETKDGLIVSIKTLSGNVYRGKMFVDATYEGDLMAAAGVKYHVGREANSVYGETLNGNQPGMAIHHQLSPGVDPYVVPSDPKSGLLGGVEPYDPNMKPGDGDARVQAYCFRMCLTDNPDNKIPFAKPDGYDERDYELMFRHYEAVPPETAKKLAPPWINSRMPNRKTDTNNRRGFSTDFIGQSWRWAEASYEEREKILAAHLKYQKGLMWTLANHPRVPECIRREVSRWGTCRDEFKDGFGDGWQKQLYVREARRLVGEYVMTEHNCRGKAVAARPIAMGAYAMDSHHVRRYVGADGFVHNEGDVEVGKDENGNRFPPYPIDYGAIVPKRGECVNLLVPVCVSASHIAFGSIRMEPVFFALGQAAGTAAAIACTKNAAVQDVPYGELRERLLADGQVLKMEVPNDEKPKAFSVSEGADAKGGVTHTLDASPVVCECAATVEGREPSLLPKGRRFKLVWHDEFDGDVLDASKWGWRTSFWGRPAHWFATPEDNAHEVRDGLLHLKLVKRPDGQFVSPQLQTGEIVWDIPHDDNGKNFWPIKKRDKPKFMHRYGYYECRCRLQQMPGWWSAFWMQAPMIGCSADPRRAGIEHDIMESFDPGKVIPHCYHFGGYGAEHRCFKSPRVKKNAAAMLALDKTVFHVFGLLWEPDGYTVFIDGKQHGPKVGRGKGEAVSETEEFILLTTEAKWYRNNRMTGKGVPELEAAAASGDEFLVDYVRVYDIAE